MMAEWRECEFAGDFLTRGAEKCLPGSERVCKLPVADPTSPTLDICAACPVPALVEAVRAADEYYGGGAKTNYPSAHLASTLKAALTAIEEAKP